MLDFDRKPTPKSEEEKAFDALNEQYAKKFGKPYAFAVGISADTMRETLADMRRRIDDNDPQPDPDYKPDEDY